MISIINKFIIINCTIYTITKSNNKNINSVSFINIKTNKYLRHENNILKEYLYTDDSLFFIDSSFIPKFDENCILFYISNFNNLEFYISSYNGCSISKTEPKMYFKYYNSYEEALNDILFFECHITKMYLMEKKLMKLNI